MSSIRQASRTTSVDFGRLMTQAKAESGFRVDAMTRRSSASGLFQFIDATWLTLVQHFGEKYGIGVLAQQIETDAQGRATVATPAPRQRILDLRNDAALSAALAAEYAQINKGGLERALGRPAGNADLYLAHFLGAVGAAALLQAVAHNGDAVAADLLPRAAAANRSVFFDNGGRARSVAEIYRCFAQRIDSEAQRFSDARAAANAGGSAAPAEVPGFVRRLGFDARQLSQPMLAMLNAFALAALQLLAGPRPAARAGAPARRSL
ncbi:MAG TPA: hypothetical protein VF502_12355 [Stellaceae bacterium]